MALLEDATLGQRCLSSCAASPRREITVELVPLRALDSLDRHLNLLEPQQILDNLLVLHQRYIDSFARLLGGNRYSHSQAAESNPLVRAAAEASHPHQPPQSDLFEVVARQHSHEDERHAQEALASAVHTAGIMPDGRPLEPIGRDATDAGSDPCFSEGEEPSQPSELTPEPFGEIELEVVECATALRASPPLTFMSKTPTKVFHDRNVEAELKDGLEDVEKDLNHFVPRNRWTMPLWNLFEWFILIQEPERSGMLVGVVKNTKFEIMCLTVIIINALFAAYVADHEMQNLEARPTDFMRNFEVALLCFYGVELVLKFAVHGLYFFVNDEWRWNFFDLAIVLLSIYDLIMSRVIGTSNTNLTFMRIFRLLKLSKVMRLFRVLRFFRELRLMLLAITQSLSSLFWALVMLAFIMYVFGLVLIQGLSSCLKDEPKCMSEHNAGQIDKFFGSMSRTIISLFQASTGGFDWKEIYDIILLGGDMYSIMFLMYIAFFSFAVMNILTGMIVENVVSMAAQDEATLLLTYRRRRNAMAEDTKRLFEKLDVDKDGLISMDEWSKGVGSDEVRALMSSMELEVNDAHFFFSGLQEVSGAEGVDINSFVNGCLKMKGKASSIDMQLLGYEARCMHRRLIEMSLAMTTNGHPLMQRGDSVQGDQVVPKGPALYA